MFCFAFILIKKYNLILFQNLPLGLLLVSDLVESSGFTFHLSKKVLLKLPNIDHNILNIL